MSGLLDKPGVTMESESDDGRESDTGLRPQADARRIRGVLVFLAPVRRAGGSQAENRRRVPPDYVRRQSHRSEDRIPGAGFAPARRCLPPDRIERRPSGRLTPEERRALIAARVARKRFVKVARLSAELGVSRMTIRRDLTQLEAEGLLVRSHGGAMRVAEAWPSLQDRQHPPPCRANGSLHAPASGPGWRI